MPAKPAPKVAKPVRRTRVLVVDDHPLVRYALAQLLNKTTDLECCGEADTYSETSG